MKPFKLIAPTAALGLAALLMAPRLVAFTLSGESLDVDTQRDVRVFNNFTDASANDNLTPDPNWPGFVGAPLAIWKAVSEWGSEPHNGNGAGDPHQSIVGSGKANFDAVWQGLAFEVGDPDSNIASELSGTSGGVSGFTETPSNHGWRIRFYAEPWVWMDGPDEPAVGRDLQGVMTILYGFALGLGNSTASGATMNPSTGSTTGTSFRSINSDDKAGIQAIYGALDPLVKPHIDTVVHSGGMLTLTGFNFDTTATNEVWFTHDGSSTDGEPVKVTGLASDGATITCTVPSNAGSGDVLVRAGALTGGVGLSNAMAIDLGPSCALPPVSYCTAGTTASGCNALLSTVGTPSASAPSGFTVSAGGVEGAKDGLFFFGTNGRQAASWGSGTSFQCVVPPVIRGGLLLGTGTNGLCDGALSQDLNALWTAKPAKNPGPGALVQAQLWFRDPFNTSNQTTSLSDAIEFSVCP